MSADDFFSRWSTRKSQEAALPETAPAAPVEPTAELPPPTLEEVAALGHDADFSRFVKPGVDETVRRSAMKKLFTDPHFNVMDGLDIYIGDYNTFEPIPPAMLAMLAHAKPLLDPLGHLQQPAMKMLDRLEQLAEGADGGETGSTPDVVPVTVTGDAAASEVVAATAGENEAIENPVVIMADAKEGHAADDTAATSKDPASPENDHTIQSL